MIGLHLLYHIGALQLDFSPLSQLSAGDTLPNFAPTLAALLPRTVAGLNLVTVLGMPALLLTYCEIIQNSKWKSSIFRENIHSQNIYHQKKRLQPVFSEGVYLTVTSY